MEIGNVRTSDPAAPAAKGAGELGAADFLQLLVTELTNQDPLSPTSNQDLLAQLSSIREIELSTTLTDSLKSLTGGQRYSSAASLIGKHVTTRAGEQGADSVASAGTVLGVRFDPDGTVVLNLDSGDDVSLEHVASVSDAAASARALVGKMVRGIDRSADEVKLVEGVVTAVARDALGGELLELDTGEQLKLDEIVSVASAAA